MPDATPNFGIRYPCAGETIDAAVFETFATDVEAAIALVDAEMTRALHRPAVRLQRGLASQSITVATTTDATYDTESFDNDSMGNLGVNNDRATIQTAGVYLAKFWVSQMSAFTTITSTSVLISQNGLTRWQKKGPQGATVTAIPWLAILGVLECAVGDIIRGRILWTGTGGPATTFGELELNLIAAIP